MAKLSEKTKAALWDVGIIATGLAGAFGFFLVVTGIVVGMPVIEVFFVLLAMGSGLP